ncbi:type II inositol-1,4,5-trisphosphate 5-phosphatase [Xylariaceae sp. FL0016]|nr:type II inositol-1,4,5-trisphosphate 5-phosphatase [Xylariaceae sp. FL0016]
MPSTNREPSIASTPDPVDSASTTHYSLSRAVNARKSEFVRPHSIRIKIGSWNVANCPGADKDLASWFVEGDGVEPGFDSKLATLNLSESSASENSTQDAAKSVEANPEHGTSSISQHGSDKELEAGNHDPTSEEEKPAIRIVGGDKIGLYVLGLQEIVGLNLVHQSFYSDPSSYAKWQDALEAALPKGYTRIACQQLVGLLLLIYASPEIAETISNESTVAVGTGLLGYMGNKGAISSRLVLGETTRLVFANCHLASGQDQTSLDRRCWDYNKIITSTKFAPISQHGVAEDEEEKLGQEDFSFCFGDLNFRLDGLPGDDIRRLLMLHTRGEYDITKKNTQERLGDDGVIVLRNNDDDSEGTKTPEMISRETSFDQSDEGEDDGDVELPNPDDFVPDPHDDPASLQATLDSLLPHDQLSQMIKSRKAFHEGWREGPITFLPTYKYDVGTVGLFDSSEKKRAPSWCDRILFRTSKDLDDHYEKCREEEEAKRKDEDMKKRGIDQAANDESVLFDYDPTTDSSAENLAVGDSGYEYDEYDEAEEEPVPVATNDGFTDHISLDLYSSHQRITSSDHKPLTALFTLKYDAVVPELKAKVHAEAARELDRAENEGRPNITIVVDGRISPSSHENESVSDGSDGVDFGEVGYLRKTSRHLTIANTGRVPARFRFVEKPDVTEGEGQNFQWLKLNFVHSSTDADGDSEEPSHHEVSLEPGETINAVITLEISDVAHIRALNENSAQLEDVLVLRVTDGRDHFIPIRAMWQPSCFGRSLEELIRLPHGGIRAMAKEMGQGGSIPYNLEVHNSSPTALFKLTEALEILTERLVADENMLEDVHVPRNKPGWPFDEQSWQTSKNENHDQLRAAIIEALEEDKPILDTLKSDVPTMTRLEVVSEVMLLFLRSMTDGIITAPLWAKIEQTLPNIASAKTTGDIEDMKTAILDILSTAPYYNISFVFLTSMLARVAGELVTLDKKELQALGSLSRKPGTLSRRSLSFRRNTNPADVIDEGAIQQRVAWEKRVAEIFGQAVCRTSARGSAKEKKATEDKMKSVVEVFLRRENP